MRAARIALGALGAVATALGALAVWAPQAVAGTEPLSTVVDAASGLGPQTLFVFGSLAVVLAVVGSALASPEDRLVAGDPAATERFERVVDSAPETVRAAEGTLLASEFDAAAERAVEGDERAFAAVRERLRALAVARLARADGPVPEPANSTADATGAGSSASAAGGADAAERAVATGLWTDDRVAAAFLSDAEGPVPSLRSRLRLWLDPETERRRRVRRTVAAIGDLQDGPVAEGGVEP